MDIIQPMKKYILDMEVCHVEHPRDGYIVLRLRPREGVLPAMRAGQFVEVRVDGEPKTFLRRPISINFINKETNELWLLLHAVGAGTRALAHLQVGDTLNIIAPLGNGFSRPGEQTEAAGSQSDPGMPYLLVGGGVGTAPLLELGKELKESGYQPVFLLGGRSSADVLQLELFRKYGEVYVTTEDGSLGERGFVTQHSLWSQLRFAHVYTCGPKPMMVAVAKLTRELNMSCEASLENLMACGLGACLCCVENTIDGNVCVCKEGPVFPVEKLNW